MFNLTTLAETLPITHLFPLLLIKSSSSANLDGSRDSFRSMPTQSFLWEFYLAGPEIAHLPSASLYVGGEQLDLGDFYRNHPLVFCGDS